jgi:hypothetical protein
VYVSTGEAWIDETIGKDEFPVPLKKFPVPREKFPVLLGTGNWPAKH